MKLMREVRCFPAARSEGSAPVADRGGAHWTLRAVVDGPVDRQTGYVFDIKAIDAWIRDIVVPDLFGSMSAGRGIGLSLALRDFFPCAAGHFSPPVVLDSLRLLLSPHLSFCTSRDDPNMVRVTQSFEFCAAHRLACRDFSDEQNRRLFGPCSNPNWHGHNYVLEVTIGGAPDAHTGVLIDPPAFERVVREHAIEPFDHKNLNLECADFADLNPSVENIARVIYRRLDGAFGRARLVSVRVWETSKTCAEYSGE